MMEMVWQAIGGFVAVWGFGVVLRTPRKLLVWAGIDGAVGWLIYLAADYWTGSVLAATFLGALAISVCAHICARWQKTPVTLFLIPANMTLVPGAGMYRVVYYTLQSQRLASSYYLQQTLQVAGMIALAIFVVNIFIDFLEREVRKNR